MRASMRSSQLLQANHPKALNPTQNVINPIFVLKATTLPLLD
jgi:hypothetical protein